MYTSWFPPEKYVRRGTTIICWYGDNNTFNAGSKIDSSWTCRPTYSTFINSLLHMAYQSYLDKSILSMVILEVSTQSQSRTW
jgi:hypothetical protein